MQQWQNYEGLRTLYFENGLVLKEEQLQYKQDIESVIDTGKSATSKIKPKCVDDSRIKWNDITPIAFGNSVFRIAEISQTPCCKVFLVRIDQGKWPCSEELYSLCDGVSLNKHSGGRQTVLSSYVRRVYLYLDQNIPEVERTIASITG